MAYTETLTKTNTMTKANQVMFKHGSQASLDILRKKDAQGKGTATPGVFYLTNDTHRLYIGNDDNIPVPVNEGIVRYSNLNAAITGLGITSATTDRQPEMAGIFVYLEEEGVLAIFNGSDLVQINSDTNTTYKFTELLSEDTPGTVTVSSSLMSKERTETAFATSAGEFSFDLAGLNGLVVDLKSNKITVTGPTIKVVGSSAAGASNKDTYVEVGLTYVDPADNKEKTASKFKIKGSTDVSVEKNASGEVVIEAVDTILKDMTVTELDSGFNIAVTDDKTAVDANIDPRIKLGDNATLYHFEKGVATLPVYTKSEIDGLIVDFDAMEYKGVFGKTQQISSLTGVKNGDTYKAGANLTVSSNGIKADAGDLIIAKGPETNGVIPKDKITWEVVPSGNEDTTYHIEYEENGFDLIGRSSVGDTATDGNNSGSIRFGATNKLSMAQTVSDTDKKDSEGAGDTVTFTFSHDETARTNSASTAYTRTVDSKYVMNNFTATMVDGSLSDKGITTDKYGHISKVMSKAYTVIDTNAVMNEMAVAAVAADNMATISLTPSIMQSNGTVLEKTGKLYLKSKNSNLSVAASGAQVTVDLVWGTF